MAGTVNTNITPPRVAFLDPRTGAVSREWYMFFLSLFNLTGSGGSSVNLEDLQVGPPGEAWLDQLAALQTGDVSPETGSDLSAQIASLRQAVFTTPPQVDFVASNDVIPPVQLGTAAAVNYSEGPWTPVVTATSGTITTYLSEGNWTRIGRLVSCTALIQITNNGTGAGTLRYTLPFNNEGAAWVGAGREAATTGNMLQILSSTGTNIASVLTYNNTYPGGTGYVLALSLTFIA